ncbi:MAG: hypothetical protein KF822_09350 [Steroidobacteraceae bacterium]|nr:hypothetical protein [Steroidobacteraceae bacterium]
MQRISRTGQNVIAESIGLSAPTVSRFVAEPEGLERACRVLAAAGLKVVPVNYQCFSADKVKILLDLARDHLNSLQRIDQLEVVDDE